VSGWVLLLRGERVLLDADVAVLYGVATGALVRAMKRNLAWFPADFMFQLTADEFANLRSQIRHLKSAHVGRPQMSIGKGHGSRRVVWSWV
jgi:hypothetical protein